MDKEQAMLLEELALFQSRLEGRPISTEEAMRLTIEQLVDSLFPVRLPAVLDDMQPPEFAGSSNTGSLFTSATG